MNNNSMCVDELIWEEVFPKISTMPIPWEYKDEDKELIGTYLCKYDNIGTENQHVYLIEDLNKKKRHVFGCTELDNLFEQVQKNDFVKIVFIAKKPREQSVPFRLFKLRQ